MSQFATAAASPPTTNPPQRQWLVVFGVFEILIACFFLLLAVFATVVFPNLPRPAGQPAMPSGMFYVVAGFYLAVAAFFGTVGMGSIRAKNWARIAMIVASSLWLGLGVFSTIVTLFVLPNVMRKTAPPSSQLPPNFQSTVFVVTAVFEVFAMVLLPLVFLLFYSNKKVKAACDGEILPAIATERPPISIIVVAVWFGFIGLGGLAAATWYPVTVVFGSFVTGVPARLIGFVIFAVSAYCAWSLFERRRQGWMVATAASAVWFISGVMTKLRMDPATLYPKIYQQMGMEPGQMPMAFTPQTMAIFWFMGLLFSFAFFALVLYTKRHFPLRQETTPKA
jgi:hypothetical protein